MPHRFHYRNFRYKSTNTKPLLLYIFLHCSITTIKLGNKNYISTSFNTAGNSSKKKKKINNMKSKSVLCLKTKIAKI